MEVENLAIYKEKMLLAKKMGDEENFKKYYTLFTSAYKNVTGKNFEDFIKENSVGTKIESNEDKMQNEDEQLDEERDI